MLDTIYNEECLEGLNKIGGGSVDCIICDLPYGTTANAWDSVIDLSKLWEQYKRIIKPNGAVLLFGQTPFDKLLGASNLSWLKYEFIWVKENATGFLQAKKAPLKNHENILVFYNKQPTYNPQMWNSDPYKRLRKASNVTTNYHEFKGDIHTVSDGARYPISTVFFKRDKDKVHPTQKPVALLEYLIKTYTNEGDVVLDNCIGSGTTAVAAVNTNRHYIGFELNADYYKIALERVARAKANKKLFYE